MGYSLRKTLCRVAATNAFIAMGTNAVSFLAATLNDHDSRLRELLMNVQGRFPSLGLDFVSTSAQSRRSTALDAAVLLGTNARPLLLEIAEAVGEWGSHEHADFLITNFQAAALKPIAIAMTNCSNVYGERTLLESLNFILRKHPTPPADEEMIIANLTCVLSLNWDEFVDRSAAYSVGRFGPKAERAIPVLLDCLTNGETKSSYPAAWALAAIRREPEKVLSEGGSTAHGEEALNGEATVSAFCPLPSAFPRLRRLLRGVARFLCGVAGGGDVGDAASVPVILVKCRRALLELETQAIQPIREQPIRRAKLAVDLLRHRLVRGDGLARLRDAARVVINLPLQILEHGFVHCHFAGENQPLICGSKSPTPRWISSYQILQCLQEV